MKKNKVIVMVGTVMLMCLVLSRLLGTQGKAVLLGVAFFGAAVIILAGILIYMYFSVSKSARKALIWTLLVGILLGGYGIMSEIQVVQDLAGGTTVENLTQCSISSRVGIHGILSNRYYLNGMDETGKSRTFPISIATHDKLENRMNVTVEFYQHTNRVVVIY